MHTVPRVCPSQWWELVRVFLTLGALSPSGPGLTGVLQTEVQEKRGWLSQASFVEGVALVDMLPGPSGAQLSIFLGYIRAGWWGGLLAGLCFLLPSFVVMLTLTLLYTHYGALPGLQGVLLWRPPWLPLPVLPAWASSAGAHPHPPGVGQIGLFFAKVGLFTCGGGLVLLAFLQDQVVEHLQWLTPQAFLDGLALGRLTPGPIPMLAAFIGYHVAGLRGAVVAGVAIFVPSFVLMLSLLPMLEHLERVAWLNAARQGMSPVIIGMIAVTLLKLVPTAVPGLFPAVLALATVGAMVGWRVGPVPLMALGAALGALGLLWGTG